MIRRWLVYSLTILRLLSSFGAAACSVAFSHHHCCATALSFSDKVFNIAVAPDFLSLTTQEVRAIYFNMPPEQTDDLPKDLHILCLGDSLTAGFANFGFANWPYGDTLQVELANLLGSTPAQIATHVDGLSGDRVDGRFRLRLEHDLAVSKDNPYDWVVILGGTNDLAYQVTADELYSGLEELYKLALQSSERTKVLALTVPESERASERLIETRDEVNERILERREERYYTFDLRRTIYYHTLDQESRERIWDDGLHLTQEGYKVMGKAIAGRLFELLREGVGS